MVLTTLVSMALAQACDASWPKLSLVVTGLGVPQTLEAPLRAEAVYEASQAGLCIVADGEVAATARIEWPEAGPLSLSITSSAVVGHSIRQLSRSVEVSGVPADGIALAVSSNLGELLREARREIPSLAPPRADSTWGLGAAVAGEVFGGGQLHGGLDVYGRWRLVGRLSLEPSLAVRGGASARSTSGSVSALLIGGALQVVFEVLRFNALALSAVGGVRAAWLRFEGTPVADATGTTASTWISSLRGGVEFEWAPRPMRVFIRLTAGAPLRAAAALDGSSRVTATTGVEGGAVIGAGGAF